MPLPEFLAEHGRPIRYGCTDTAWPITDYQTVFARRLPRDIGLGSAEMPSAGRPFTPELVDGSSTAASLLAPITLHTGVSSLEAHEPPYAERYRVPATTARIVNEARAEGRRVIAVGTTATRAIETDAVDGRAHAGEGWTELVITPERGLQVVDGIISGWHEPEASHLLLMEAVAGRPLLEASYARRAGRALPLARVRRHPPRAAVERAPLGREPGSTSRPGHRAGDRPRGGRWHGEPADGPPESERLVRVRAEHRRDRPADDYFVVVDDGRSCSRPRLAPRARHVGSRIAVAPSHPCGRRPSRWLTGPAPPVITETDLQGLNQRALLRTLDVVRRVTTVLVVIAGLLVLAWRGRSSGTRA